MLVGIKCKFPLTPINAINAKQRPDAMTLKIALFGSVKSTISNIVSIGRDYFQ